MAWSTSTRRASLPKDWHKRRARAKRNAGGICQQVTDGIRCATVGTDCDHIVRGAGDDASNLQWLCKPHHDAKTHAEALVARAAQPQRLRPPQPHPGLRNAVQSDP